MLSDLVDGVETHEGLGRIESRLIRGVCRGNERGSIRSLVEFSGDYTRKDLLGEGRDKVRDDFLFGVVFNKRVAISERLVHEGETHHAVGMSACLGTIKG